MLGFRGAYWIWPLLCTIVWTATLLGLLLWWSVADNARPYRIDHPTVVFISHVGAAHRELFIPGSALTFLLFTITLITERWLRHIRRIPGALRRSEVVTELAALVFGVLGGLALLLLSVFDAFNHKQVHWTFTAIFVLSIALSAAFGTAQTMLLERSHVERNHLRRNAIWKLTIVLLAIAGAIAFAVTYATCRSEPSGIEPSSRCDRIQSVSAVLEWFIAFLFDAYLATFILDFWPATKTSGRKFHPSLVEADRANELHTHKDGSKGAPNGAEFVDFDDGRTSQSTAVERPMREV